MGNLGHWIGTHGRSVNRKAGIELLVQRAKRGDRLAFGELFDLYATRVFQYLAFQLDGQVEVAQELCEQVFMDVIQRLADAEAPFSGWLYRMANSRLTSYLNGGWQVACEAVCHG